MKRRTSFAILAAAFACTLPALAQDKWPSRPIEMIFPYPPGNDSDAVMRLVAQGMSKRLGVPVQLINKPGGGGVVGTADMVRAKPDGYTIGVLTSGSGITQVIAGNTPYKQSDFMPIAGIFGNDFVLAARSDFPASNLQELAAWAKTNNKTVVIGSYSPAAAPALIAAKIAKQDGWKYKIVSFANPSAKELTAGDAELTTTTPDLAAPFVKSGQVKVLSSWTPARSRNYPNVPTLKEAGYGDLYAWSGIIAPAGLPADIGDRLSEAARQALGDKEVVDLLARLGSQALSLDRQQMARKIEADTKWMTEIADEIGLRKK